uniref:Ig-like domain-containing protein n=1 Tax=Lepisosteus oculatus TaxID=7918 RepID=W5M9N4_LEPOC
MKSDQLKWLHVTFLLVHQCSVSQSDTFRVFGPSAPVVVFRGEDTVLPCYLSPNISAVNLEIRWFREDYTAPVCLYRYGRYNFNNQITSYRGRAELFPEEFKKSNVSLKLKSVRHSDHGLYKCMVKSQQWYEEANIYLAVRALGTHPSVSLLPPGREQSQLLCRTEGWYPEPVVIWTDRDGNNVTSLSTTTAKQDSQGLFSVSSYIPVNQESTVFSCMVRSPLPEPDWESQLYIFVENISTCGPWALPSSVIPVASVVAVVLLVIQWKKMNGMYSSVVAAVLAEHADRLNKYQLGVNQLVKIAYDTKIGSCHLTLDPNTVHCLLSLSEKNRKVTRGEKQPYPDHPERFDFWQQVLCGEGLTGRCYWEAEWSGDWAYIGVTYKGIKRKGEGDDTHLGHNDKSWCLQRWGSNSSAWHNNSKTDITVPLTKKTGVYLDWPVGTLSFYSVSPEIMI